MNLIKRKANSYATLSVLLLILILLLPHIQPAIGFSEQTSTYIILVSPAGSQTQSIEFLDRLAGMGVSLAKSYPFQSLGEGGVVNLTESQASQVQEAFHPFLMLQSRVVYVQQIATNTNQTFNQTWSYFPGGNYTGKNVTVAVIDTGVDSNIPALAGKVVGGYNFVDNNNNITDTDGHGTAVASIIAADSKTFKGVAPDAKILAYKIFSLNETTSALVVEAIDRAASDGANIINLSLGGSLDSETLWKIGYALEQKGIALVAAAGNEGPSLQTLSSPGDLAPYLSVGASTSSFTDSPMALLNLNGSLWLESALPMLNSPMTDGIIKGKYVFVGSATPQDVKNLDLKGKIAISLRDRKTTFSQMDYDVASAGAMALVVINDENSSLQGVVFNNMTPAVPAVAISSSDGQKLDLLQSNNSYLELQIFIPNSTYPAFFSSRGPADLFTMKPEILAPGDMVPALTPQGSFLLSGTSFSAPQVAGAMALLMQEHRSLTPVEYYSMLTLSAEKLYRWNQTYPSYVEGAGEMNITKALHMQFALERQDYEMVYPFKGGVYNDTLQFTLFSDSSHYNISYTGPYRILFNQTFISQSNPSLEIKVPWFSINNNSGSPYFDSSIIISGKNENYSIPVIAVPNQIGIYFDYSDYSLHSTSTSFSSASGNLTMPDGTVYALTVQRDGTSQLPLPNLIPGYYDVFITFTSGNSNITTSYLSFYIASSKNLEGRYGYYPVSALYSLISYSAFLVIVSLSLLFYRRLSKSSAGSEEKPDIGRV
ncbi:MAG: S8 family serine peptidase [Conexivisphaerales archaeon]